ncbi:glycosyltransferase family 2 protein [bacterium]|nr:glycosyltransferase family 2 protein [bacterium]
MMTLDMVTVVILTKNEALMIGDCLASCAAFKHRWVIDSGSTDATLAIASAAGAQLTTRSFTTFRDVRAYALSSVTTPWILFLDADERLSDALVDWIKTTIGTTTANGVRIPRHNFLLGEWVKYSGWSPDFQTRLCRVAAAKMGPQSVHESVEITGETIEIPPDGDAYIRHYTCTDLGTYISKINHYTSIEAVDRRDDPAFKTSGVAIISRSFGMFTQTLFHHKGYKDGARGVIVAVLNMIVSLMLMIKIWEARHHRDTPTR